LAQVVASDRSDCMDGQYTRCDVLVKAVIYVTINAAVLTPLAGGAYCHRPNTGRGQIE
jgi:hypothetical protein